jgi:phenylacetate-coenzyme A ligase PaaK-like adenylate-forming protein
MSAQAANTVNSWWRPSRRFAASQPLHQTVGQLNEWRPEVLVAYASMVGILAEEQLSGRLNIHPHVVYSASELLTAHIRQRAREAWGDEPFDQYVATEAGGIASEHLNCRHMHFYEDLVIVENVDEQYKPVPPGEFGAKLLVTPLFSRIQPLIRYELNDSVRMSAEPPTCGLPFTVLEGIQGRVEEALTLPSRTGGKVAIQPLVFTRIMDILPLNGWQVVQQADNSLTVLLAGVHDGLTNEQVAQQLTQSLAKEGAQVPPIQVQRVAEIPKTAAGKAPLVKAYRAAV